MRGLKWLRSVEAWAALAVASAPWLWFYPVTLGQKIFFGDDISSFFFPVQLELARALQENRLPLWTMYLDSGFPLFAEGQVAALDPFNLALYRFLPAHLALACSIVLRVSWLGVGMYVFCRAAGVGVAGALFAGLVFQLSGFATAHLQHVTFLAVLAWLPWLLWLQNRMQVAWQDRQRAWVGWFALTTLAIAIQFVSGFPQVALINLIPFGLSGVTGILLWHRRAPTTARDGVIALGLTGLAMAFGVGLASAQILPTLELMTWSVRAQELGAEFFTSYSLDPKFLTQFVSPFWQLGDPGVSNQEYWGYLGVLPLALIPWAWRRRDARVWFFCALGIGALILALGKFAPVYEWLYLVPVFNRFRVPARFLLIATFAFIFLAATGLDELLKRARDTRAPLAILCGGASVVALGATVWAREALPLDALQAAWGWLPWVWCASALVLVALAFGRAPRGVLVAGVITVALIDLLLFAQTFARTINPLVAAATWATPARAVQAMDASTGLARTLTTVYNETLRPNWLLVNEQASPQIYSPLGLRRNEDYLETISAGMLNALNVRYYTRVSYPRAEDLAAWNYAFAADLFAQPVALPPTRVAQIELVSYADQIADLPDDFVAGEIELTTADGAATILPIRVGVETVDWAHASWSATTGIRHRPPAHALAFAAYLPAVRRNFDGVKASTRIALAAPATVTSLRARATLPHGELVIERLDLVDESGRAVSLAALTHANDLALVFKSHAVAMFENRDVLPRAFIAHRAQIADDAETLAQMRRVDFDPTQIVFLNAGDPLSPAARAATDRVTLAEYRAERVVIHAQTDQPGYLILADSFYPGWEATLDGTPAPIYRADYIFRAVRLEPGAHTVVFEFHSRAFALGVGVSAATLLLGGAFVAWAWRAASGKGR